MIYVIAGEGVQRIGGMETKLVAGTFATLPRGTPHTITRRGGKPMHRALDHERPALRARQIGG